MPTREGLYFVSVLLFVMGGAVARELNLLIVLAGMMIGPLVFHARMVLLALRRLSVSRRLPRRIQAGESLHVRIGIANGRRQLGAWLLRARDRITYRNGQGDGGIPPTAVDVAVPLVEPAGETWVSYRAHLTRRGLYEFGPITVSTRFPLGLLECSRRFDARQELIVCPRLGRMTAEWDRLTQGGPTGTQAALARQGLTEDEFHGLREWRPGDSRRWVHWRTSARLSTLSVKQFERKRHRSLALLLDLRMPARPTETDRVRLELVVSIAATALTDIARQGLARVTLAIAGARPGCWSGAASPRFVDELIDRLAAVEGGSGATLAEAARMLVERWPGGAPGVVLSTRPMPADAFGSVNRSAPAELFGGAAGTAVEARRLDRVTWIDAGRRDLDRFFQWSHGPVDRA